MEPKNRPKRTSDVARFLAENGIREARLVKGPGYFCFEGKATDDWIGHPVEVPFLGDLTCGQWLRKFKAMNDDPANGAGARKTVIDENAHRQRFLEPDNGMTSAPL